MWQWQDREIGERDVECVEDQRSIVRGSLAVEGSGPEAGQGNAKMKARPASE